MWDDMSRVNIRHFGQGHHYFCIEIQESFVVYKADEFSPLQPELEYGYRIKHGLAEICLIQADSFYDAAKRYVNFKMTGINNGDITF